MNYLVEVYQAILMIDKSTFTRGKGNKKPLYQNNYELLDEYRNRLITYAYHIKTCGNDRNSYSKTDKDATFKVYHKCVVGDAGSYTNYIFCEEINIEKCLKFAMYKKCRR